jgi:uncharacterized protein (TIGR00255 family)
MRSMTGFGAAQAHVDGIDYSVEIRSVNGRYFKASSRLPELWSSLEIEVEKLLRERLARGTITLTLRMRMSEAAAAYTVNTVALRRYIEQARAAVGADARLDIGALLALPGVCEPPSSEDLCEQHRPHIMAAITQAVDVLLDMRRREGAAMLADLEAHTHVLRENLDKIEARKQRVVENYQQRLLARVQELTRAAELSLGATDLMREVALFAERSDISEEVARLRSHLDQFARACRQEDQAGRKLDFIAQEMHREASTISAKANDVEISLCIVEVKSSIDRIKEQVQNVE